MTPDPLSARLTALVAKWRKEYARVSSFHATMGSGWNACANDLETELQGLTEARETPTCGTCATCEHWTAATSRQHGACEQGISFSQVNGDTPYNFGCVLHEPTAAPQTTGEGT